MGKFIKLLIILAAVTGLFMYYPNIAGYETDPQQQRRCRSRQTLSANISRQKAR